MRHGRVTRHGRVFPRFSLFILCILSESRIFKGEEFTRRKPDTLGAWEDIQGDQIEVARPRRDELWSAQAAQWQRVSITNDKQAR